MYMRYFKCFQAYPLANRTKRPLIRYDGNKLNLMYIKILFQLPNWYDDEGFYFEKISYRTHDDGETEKT